MCGGRGLGIEQWPVGFFLRQRKLEFGGRGSGKHGLVGGTEAIPERPANAERQRRAVPVDAGAGRVRGDGVKTKRVAGDGATAFGRKNVTGAHGLGKLRRRDRHRLEAEAAGNVAREALHVRLAAGECAHGIDAFGGEEVAARAGVCGQHRLDAEIGGEFVPQHLAAAEPDPRLQVLRVETVIARKAREIGEAAMGIEVVVLAGEIEVGFAPARTAASPLATPKLGTTRMRPSLIVAMRWPRRCA